jgi:hypothetical protein
MSSGASIENGDKPLRLIKGWEFFWLPKRKSITNGDVVILTPAVQQIITGLRTSDTEAQRFIVVTKAVYGLVLKQ